MVGPTMATANGRAIRAVSTRFGTLYAIGGTDMAYATLPKAVAYAKSLPLLPDTQLQVNWGEGHADPLSNVWEDIGTLSEFWEANQFSFSPAEVEEINTTLAAGDVYQGGGGAAGTYGLRVAPEEEGGD